MKINLGYDEHGNNVVWDTDTSPLLNVLGQPATGKSTLLDRIIRQADSCMAVTRFEQENRPLPSPTVMGFTYPTDGDETGILEILQRVRAEQERRRKRNALDSLDAKPLMLAFDDFTEWADKSTPETLREITGIMQHARGTRVSLVLAEDSYQQTCSALRQAVGHASLCDAGTHIVLGSLDMGEPIRPANREYANILMRRISGNGAHPQHHGIQQTNAGGIHALTIPHKKGDSR